MTAVRGRPALTALVPTSTQGDPAAAGSPRRLGPGAVASTPDVGISEADFDAWFAGHKRRLFGLAVSVLRDRGEAEDAVAETMWKAWAKWDSVREPDKREAWVTKVCLHECFRRRRRLGRIEVVDVEAVGERPAATGGPADLDLDRAFRTLPPKQRAAVLLHYHHGYSVEQTAELMGCRPGTVRTHVQRALASLRQQLREEQADER